MSSPTRAPAVDVERFVRLTDVSLDDAYALLANPRTRLTLHVLSTCDSRLSVATLTDAVARRDELDVDAVRASLVHTVLPKLDAYELVEYDRDADAVRLDGPVVAAADPIADLAGTPESEPESAGANS
ncbi:DUF7344 domain-containing protein [Natrinema salifodinae]|uniref:DUF7344 domain-containing protein n=1 Tax=Natrinema salifodinae TaxID=1202768 RepID=A0A1I0PI21_9EURY|nr:hypothetical protein [Natrinema salifodinae]SEW14091.1 hypothetical protein SAMN05216285_2598 [Natrinema salifodinae]